MLQKLQVLLKKTGVFLPGRRGAETRKQLSRRKVISNLRTPLSGLIRSLSTLFRHFVPLRRKARKATRFLANQ